MKAWVTTTCRSRRYVRFRVHLSYGQETAAAHLAGGEKALPAQSARHRNGKALGLRPGFADSSHPQPPTTKMEDAREVLGPGLIRGTLRPRAGRGAAACRARKARVRRGGRP